MPKSYVIKTVIYLIYCVKILNFNIFITLILLPNYDIICLLFININIQRLELENSSKFPIIIIIWTK